MSAELVLPGSKEMYLALKDSGVEWKNGKIHITIKADKPSQLKAGINSLLRLYSSLLKIEEVV